MSYLESNPNIKTISGPTRQTKIDAALNAHGLTNFETFLQYAQPIIRNTISPIGPIERNTIIPIP